MKKKDIYTLGALFILTVLTAVFSKSEKMQYLTLIILGLSALKFGFVTFQFMEMKEANGFWKGFITGFLVLFVGVISIILG